MKLLLNFTFILFLMAACLSEARMLKRTLKGDESNEDLFSKLRTKIAQFNAKDFDTYVEEVVAPEQTAAAPQVATRRAVVAPSEEEPVVETVCALQGEAAISCDAAAGDSDCGKVIATYSSCQAFIDVALLCPQLVNAYQNCAQPPPPPSPPPPPPLGGGNCGDAQTTLDMHNQARAAAGAAPLVWNDSIAQSAQAWADGCNVGNHSYVGYGENISWGPGQTCAASTQAWLAEGPRWHQGMGFTMDTGHFTQIMWKGTTQIGCGLSNCSGTNFVVCQYDTPGNMGDAGNFDVNVIG